MFVGQATRNSVEIEDIANQFLTQFLLNISSIDLLLLFARNISLFYIDQALPVRNSFIIVVVVLSYCVEL